MSSSGAGKQRPQPRRDERRVAVLKAHRPEAQNAVIEPAGIDIDRRASSLQFARQLEGAAVAGAAIDREIDQRHLVMTGIRYQRHPAIGQPIERRRQRSHQALPALAPRRRILGDEEAERRQQTDDLLLADLADAADAMLRRARKLAPVDEIRWWQPQLRPRVLVEHLQRGGGDEIASAAQYSRRLRTAQRLAAAEDDEIGALGDEAPQIAGRRQLRGGIDEDGDAASMRHGDDLRQGRARPFGGDMENGGGLRCDRVGDLPGLAVAYPGAAEAVGDAGLDEANAGGAHRMIVEIALAARDD